MLKKTHLEKNSFEGQNVIDENKTWFQIVVLLPSNLYQKVIWFYYFWNQLVICSRELGLKTIICFLYCQDLPWVQYLSNYWHQIVSVLVEISHLYFLICCCYTVSHELNNIKCLLFIKAQYIEFFKQWFSVSIVTFKKMFLTSFFKFPAFFFSCGWVHSSTT